MPESTWELMLPFQVFHPMLGDGQMSNSTTFQATKLKGKKVSEEKMGYANATQKRTKTCQNLLLKVSQ